MKIVISALHFAWQDLTECLGRARNAFGLDGVELSWHSSFARPHCTRQDLAELAHGLGGPPLALSAHIWEDLAQSTLEAGRQHLRAWLTMCATTGVRDLILHGGTSPEREAGIAHTRRILEDVLPEFERGGVVLNVENHYAYDYHEGHELMSEPWEFERLFSLNSPSLRFCFDTGHGHMTRNSRRLLGDLAPWLNYIHLADNQGVNDDHAMFRQGTVDWDGVFGQLRAIGFDGTFCVEFPVREDPAPFQWCVAEIRQRWAAPARSHVEPS